MTTWANIQRGPKNVPLYFCLYLRQFIINFHNAFTGTLCRQFAIMWLLHIPPHRKRVLTLPCEISMKYAYIMIITNILVKLKKKHFRPTLQWMVCMTLNCVGLTQSSVIQIIHQNAGLKRFFHSPKFLLLTLVFAYTYISQSSVGMHSPYGGICNNHVIANCLRSVPVKEFWKLVNNWQHWQK